MNEQPMTDARLRRFLLGQVDDEERQQIEILFITDRSFKERMLAVEQDLVDDYLIEGLSGLDKERFLLGYAQTSEQQQKLMIMRSVREWAIREANPPRFRPLAISILCRLFAGFRLKPVFVIPISASTMIAIKVAV